MTVARYGLGLLLAAATLAPVLIGAVALRRSLLPAWSGPPARLAECVLSLTGLILVLQLLGLVGLLEAVPLVLASVGLGAAAWTVAGRLAPREPGHTLPGAPDPGGWPVLVSVVGAAVVLAEWCTRLLPALDHGMTGADTVWYHLPQAAGFVQDASITHVQFFETGAGTAFYPATSGLLHALGMLWLGNDFLSVLLNLGWLGLAFLAAWCLGRPYGRGPACVLGACVLLATPIMVETQPGGAYNDLMGIALLLGAAALLVNGGPVGVPGTIAALAAALALGTKLTMAVPLAALTVGVIAVTPAGQRLRTAGVWLGAALALGSIWYARNLFAFGNPVPAANIELGPISLPSPPLTKLTYSLVHYLDTPGVWGDTFLPGLLEAFGPAWWAMLALAAAGMVAAALWGRTRVERMLGVVAVVSGLAVLVTPQGLGTDADPVFFKFNLRYPSPALLLGLTLLPLAVGGRALGGRIVLGAYAAVLALTQLDPAIWPTDLREDRFAAAPGSGTALASLALGAGALAIAGSVAVVRRESRSPGPGLRAAAVLAVALLVLPGGYLVARHYMDHRYDDYGPMPQVARWASDAEDARIAIVGFFIQYPLYGNDLSNRVDYVARHGPHGAFTPFKTCRAWRQALADGDYDYVVTTPFNYPGNVRSDQPPESRWTGTDPGARLMLRERGVVSLYRLDAPPDPLACG